MGLNKPYIDYEDEDPLHLAEIMENTADGIDSDIIYKDSPVSAVELRANAGKLREQHAALLNGGKPEHLAFQATHQICVEMMHTVGGWANYKCAGSATLLTNLKIPFYDASGKGKEKSTNSLINGEKSGEAVITVPVEKTDEAYIAIYSLDFEALISDYKLAGGNSHCKFTLKNLPIAVKIYVRWAAINAEGISEFSEPYPIIVT